MVIMDRKYSIYIRIGNRQYIIIDKEHVWGNHSNGSYMRTLSTPAGSASFIGLKVKKCRSR